MSRPSALRRDGAKHWRARARHTRDNGHDWDPRARRDTGMSRQRFDRPPMLLCRDRDFSIATKLSISKKKKKNDPQDLGRHNLVSKLRYTNYLELNVGTSITTWC